MPYLSSVHCNSPTATIIKMKSTNWKYNWLLIHHLKYQHQTCVLLCCVVSLLCDISLF